MSSKEFTVSENSLNGLAIGERLKAERLRMHLNQKSMADRLGLKSAAAVSRYEAGQVPEGDIVHRYALIFGVTPNWIYYGSDKGAGTVTERPEPYGDLEKEDRGALREFYKFLKEADPGRKDHIRKQIRYLLERFKGK